MEELAGAMTGAVTHALDALRGDRTVHEFIIEC
jgi:hypothetical protein